MRRYIAAALLALLTAACGGSSLTSNPTPRPEGERGRLLNPIDKTRNVTDDLNQQQQQQDEYFNQQEYPATEP